MTMIYKTVALLTCITSLQAAQQQQPSAMPDLDHMIAFSVQQVEEHDGTTTYSGSTEHQTANARWETLLTPRTAQKIFAGLVKLHNEQEAKLHGNQESKQEQGVNQ